MSLIDLSAPIEPSRRRSCRSRCGTEIEYADHAAGAQQIEALFGVPARLLRDGEGWAARRSRASARTTPPTSTRRGTTTRPIRGEPAKRIDELPLEWFFARACVLDMTDRGDGEAITAADVEAELARDRPRARSRSTSSSCTPAATSSTTELDYIARGPGVTAEATRWLYERGVRVMGIDAWGWDRRFTCRRPRRSSATSPGSSGRRTRPTSQYSQIERLVNLGALPADGLQGRLLPAAHRRRVRRPGARGRDRALRRNQPREVADRGAVALARGAGPRPRRGARSERRAS